MATATKTAAGVKTARKTPATQNPSPQRPARKASAAKASAPVRAKVTRPTTRPAAAAPAPAPAAPSASAPESAKAPKAVKPAKATDKVKKPKLVRDSFTIPKAEYEVIAALKLRAAKLGQTPKKSELLRAGIKLLAGLSDQALLASLAAVPSIKTGRPAA